jgi:anion-transporting  ArsA/GET3 family ATPase
MPELDVTALLTTTRVLVCCGSGGVGKTTTAAALGLLAVQHGRNVLVMTIDPAKRLAQSMGLDDLSHEPQRIDLAALAAADPSTRYPGSLSAMMLDTKHTFDALIEKYAPSATVKQTIFANSYYQHLSTSLMGSREFMAMEKVYEITVDNAFDLVIVDTPPSEHALDFIDAPRRLFELFEGSFVNLLLQPYRLAGRIGFDLFRRSSDRVLKVFEKLTGYEVLADLSDFFLAFSGMFDGFKDRSRKVGEILRHADTRFLLVCAPEPTSLAQADRFFARIGSERLPLGGLIVNRVHRAYGDRPLSADDLTDSDRAALANVPDRALGERPLLERLLDSHRELSLLAQGDAAAITATNVAQRVPTTRVPRFDRDLASLGDLKDFAAALGQSVAQPHPAQ